MWLEIARYLPGNNLFLNTDIARNIHLDKEIAKKILLSFTAAINKMSPDAIVPAIQNFFKTSNLAKDDNRIYAYSKIMNNIVNSIEKPNAKAFSENFNNYQSALNQRINIQWQKKIISLKKIELLSMKAKFLEKMLNTSVLIFLAYVVIAVLFISIAFLSLANCLATIPWLFLFFMHTCDIIMNDRAIGEPVNYSIQRHFDCITNVTSQNINVIIISSILAIALTLIKSRYFNIKRDLKELSKISEILDAS